MTVPPEPIQRPEPLVSVVVPSRDRPQLLPRAVRSVLTQSYREVEVIVVDDASEPPVRLPADLAADGRVSLVRLERRRTASGARNEGVGQARGELVGFLDDDDEWRPTMLERLVGELGRSGDDVAAAECGYEQRDPAGRLVRVFVPDPGRDLARSLLVSPCLQPSTVVLRRAAFLELGGFDEAAIRVEDWDLWLRFADRYRATAVPEILVDRTASTPDPRQLLRGYEHITAQLRPRIAILPSAERRRLEAWHTFNLGIHHTMVGQRREARRLLLRAWRRNPVAMRPLLHLVRTVVGERVWSGLATSVRRVVHRLLRAVGREPLLVRR